MSVCTKWQDLSHSSHECYRTCVTNDEKNWNLGNRNSSSTLSSFIPLHHEVQLCSPDYAVALKISYVHEIISEVSGNMRGVAGLPVLLEQDMSVQKWHGLSFKMELNFKRDNDIWTCEHNKSYNWCLGATIPMFSFYLSSFEKQFYVILDTGYEQEI